MVTNICNENFQILFVCLLVCFLNHKKCNNKQAVSANDSYEQFLRLCVFVDMFYFYLKNFSKEHEIICFFVCFVFNLSKASLKFDHIKSCTCVCVCKVNYKISEKIRHTINYITIKT